MSYGRVGFEYDKGSVQSHLLFLRFLPNMDVTTDLNDVTWTIYSNFCALMPRRPCIEFDLNLLSELRRCFNVQNLFNSFRKQILVSMTRKCHNKKLQTNPRHRERET